MKWTCFSDKRDIAAATRTNGWEQNKVKKFLKMRDFNWKTRARKSVKLLHPITIWAASDYIGLLFVQDITYFPLSAKVAVKFYLNAQLSFSSGDPLDVT